MSKRDWVLLWILMVLGIGAVIWADKGSYLNAVVTGQCSACPHRQFARSTRAMAFVAGRRPLTGATRPGGAGTP